jgi:hypothetical protein
VTTVDADIARAQNMLSSLGSTPTSAAVAGMRGEFFDLIERIPEDRFERAYLVEGFTLLESLAS